MPQHPNSVLAPPTTIDVYHDKVVSQPLWTDSATLLASLYGASLHHFFSDEECTALSGVPERSLRLLQTSHVIHATKAPLQGGSYKRVWHVPEVAVAAVVECVKRATGIDYATVAKITLPASLISRMLFADYLQMSKEGIGNEFGAALIVTPNHDICLQVNNAVVKTDPVMRDLAIGNGIIPASTMENGTSKTISRDDAVSVDRFLAAFNNSRFNVVINLKNVFEQFERDARAMRT